MTADWARIPWDVPEKISVRIVNEVDNVNRIVYDITSKPPATRFCKNEEYCSESKRFPLTTFRSCSLEYSRIVQTAYLFV
nr:hypothetical protein [Paenibacillus baekrokdamisoli]